jgi:hypothetical protein
VGYTTDFNGSFSINKSLGEQRLGAHHAAYLRRFAETRRMKRDVSKLVHVEDHIRVGVGLPLGNDGEYFVGADGYSGQDRSEDVLDYNSPPANQPGLWCQWTVNNEGDEIIWDGGEKFYDYVEWLEYIIEHFLKPWGYKLNGSVEWAGESTDDRGIIIVKDNKVESRSGHIVYTEVNGDKKVPSLELESAEQSAAFITNNGFDCVVVQRVGPNGQDAEHKQHLLNNDEWQQVVDHLNESMKNFSFKVK